MKNMSDARVMLLVMIALSALASLIAFCSPYWLASDRRIYGAKFDKLGLWETCFRSVKDPNDISFSQFYSGCRWVFSSEYKQSFENYLLPTFFVATQATYTLGFVFLIIAVIGILAIQLCFVMDNEIIAMRVLSFLTFISAILSTTACIIFGVRGNDRDWMPNPEHNYLSWSYALAVISSFCQWVTSILFYVENRILYRKRLKQNSHIFEMGGKS